MKSFRYCFCVLSVLLVLLVGFSVTANAQAFDVPPYTITQRYGYSFGYTGYAGTLNFTPNDGETTTYSYYSDKLYQSGTTPVDLNITYQIKPTNNEMLLESKGSVKLTFRNTAVQFLLCGPDGKCTSYHRADTMRVLLYYKDGTMEYVDDVIVAPDGMRTMIATFTPKKSVASLEFILTKSYTPPANTYFFVGCNAGEGVYGDSGHELLVDIESEESGLLKGIIEWLKGIKDGITNVFNSIAELPSKIWGFIENGLKSLFVPDEEFITDYRDRMDTMLEEKLGAVYQFANITFDGWDRITANDQNNTIEFPSATIHLGDTDFTFGGYIVKIVPDGFEFIVTVIKTIIGILCTLAFVNGMRKRYDDVMGGGST